MNKFLFELYGLPNWLLGFVCIGFFWCVGLGGHLLFRRYLYSKMRLSAETNEGLNFYAQTVGVLYGLLMGLVAVSCWNNFDELDVLVGQEVTAIGSFYRMSSGIQSAAASELQASTLTYLDEVVNVEWPRYTEGMQANEVPQSFLKMRNLLFKLRPENRYQEEVFQLLLSDFEKVIESRRLRINAFIDSGIPIVFWEVMLAGAILTIGLTYYVHFPSLLAHLSLTLIYCTSLGFMFFLIAVLDNPYRGDVRVSIEPYKTLYSNLKQGGN